MKYLKTYENLFSKYSVGDYILDYDGRFGKIVGSVGDFKKVFNHVAGKFDLTPYNVEYLNGTFKISGDWVKRKMTPEEIEQFETEKIGKNYNL